MKHNTHKLIGAGILSVSWLFAVASAIAHCDTLDGPVVSDAKVALAEKNITPVLKWIRPEHEAELKAAFARTLTVRAQGEEALELADQFFFETLVRVHRAGEGAPYTGLKPAGTKLDPAIEAADQALKSGKADALVRTISEEVAVGVRKRFAEAVEKKQHSEHSVDDGREYAAAYVEFIHYVEALHTTAVRVADHGHSAVVEPAKSPQEHEH